MIWWDSLVCENTFVSMKLVCLNIIETKLAKVATSTKEKKTKDEEAFTKTKLKHFVASCDIPYTDCTCFHQASRRHISCDCNQTLKSIHIHGRLILSTELLKLTKKVKPSSSVRLIFTQLKETWFYSHVFDIWK